VKQRKNRKKIKKSEKKSLMERGKEGEKKKGIKKT